MHENNTLLRENTIKQSKTMHTMLYLLVSLYMYTTSGYTLNCNANQQYGYMLNATYSSNLE